MGIKKIVSDIMTYATMQVIDLEWEEFAEVMDEVARQATEKAEMARYKEPITDDGDE